MSAVPRPVRLVYHANGRLRMGREAVSILQRVKGPIAVVSACGPARQGKSYISNQLLGRTSGFQLSPNYPDGGTKGLWMWSSPLKKIAADGTEYNILVIDTEGIDGCIQWEKYFYLAVVLSSMLIYNQMGLIGTSSYHYLSVVPKMTDMTVGDTTASELGQFSPILVWLLRDFSIYLDGTSPCEYMESCLKLEDVSVHDKVVNAENKVRKSIKDLFADRHCFTLERPLAEEKKLRVLDQIPVHHLTQEFQNELDEFRRFVFEKLKPKKIGATVMTGPIFVQITRYILDAFNHGKRPTIACIWEHVEKTKLPKALKSATTATVVGNPPAANTRQRKRSLDDCSRGGFPTKKTQK